MPPTRRVPKQLVLDPRNCAVVLHALARTDVPGSQELYTRLISSWGNRSDRAFITFRPTQQERNILRKVPLPARVVQSPPRYVAVYRCDKRPSLEVTLRTNDRPPRKQKFKVAGGTRRFTLVSLKRRKESNTMANTKSKGSTKSKKAPVEDELEAELEGLEEIDLDEDEDEDEDAPEVEEDEDEDDDEYASMTAAQLKAECKKRGIKGVDKKNKATLIGLLEANDAEDEEEEDDEEEDEDEGPDFDSMSRAELKAHIKAEGLPVRVTKGMSDDDIRAAIVGEDDDEEEEDDEPAPPPKKGTKKAGTTKSTSKGKAKGKQPGQLVRELPNGRLSAADVAEMAGTNALAVRNFLRSEAGQRWPKNEELGRYAFTSKQATQIVKAMKGRTRAKK